jgi:toxin YoeB
MRLKIDSQAETDLLYWQHTNAKILVKIERLIQNTLQTPFKGLGKPEPLKHQLRTCWSRRIDKEHRLIYLVKYETVTILSCRYHYGD